MSTTTPLSERIQAAIKAGKSMGVEALIFEAEAASKQAVTDHGAARDRALDPLLSDAEIAAARKAMEDADFTRERMTKAAAVLREKLTEFKGAENQAALRKVYDAATAKRDAASAGLKAEYLDLANKLGALLAAVADADRAVEAANRQLPGGAPRIATVEQHARPALRDWRSNYPIIPGTVSEAPLLTRSVLPAFTCGAAHIWGPVSVGHSFEYRFTPEPAAEGASDPSSGAAKAGGSVLERPGSPVRLISQTGAAA